MMPDDIRSGRASTCHHLIHFSHIFACTSTLTHIETHPDGPPDALEPATAMIIVLKMTIESITNISYMSGTNT